MPKFTEVQAVTLLKNKNINLKNRTILIENKLVGLKCWSAIDFLCNHLNYNYGKQ